MTNFMHFSDAHIGHRQYNMKLRRDDMYMSFRTAIKDGLEEDIDFAIFSGDLFHHKKVNARALRDAEKGLDIFWKNDVPVVVIQGNHDSKLYKEDLTWLEYLHSKGKVILLEGDFTDEGPVYEEHDFDEPGISSGFVEFDGVRIFGLQYSGQRTGERLDTVTREIEMINDEYGEPDYTIFMGHFGIEGHIPGMSGGISYNKLTQMEDVVDYVALGHLHKNYSHGDWVFNPGSLEAHNTREATWDLGYYIGKVTGENDIDVEHRLSKRRPFYKIEFSVEQYDNKSELLEGFKAKVEEELEGLEKIQEKEHHMKRGERRDPILDLRLKGLLRFSRSILDIEELMDIVREKTDAVKVQPSDATESIETEKVVEEIDGGRDEIFDEEGQLNRKKLENAVFQLKAEQDSRYREKKEEVSEMLMAIKKELLSDEPPESIAENIKKKRRNLFPEGGEKE